MNFEPLRVSLLESKEVAGLAGVISAVHVGVEENGEMWWKLQLVQGEDVVTIGGRGGRVVEESAKVVARTREICWIWW